VTVTKKLERPCKAVAAEAVWADRRSLAGISKGDGQDVCDKDFPECALSVWQREEVQDLLLPQAALCQAEGVDLHSTNPRNR
jgi:hypothetical protein